MTKLITTDQRRRNMSAIRSTHSKLEDKITQALWLKGFRFRKNVKNLFGKPDIAIKKYKVVIFIDSCFWHACPIHGNLPKNNNEFWINKLARNKQRDEQVSEYYRKKKWNFLRIWEHEVNKDFKTTLEKIAHFIDLAKSSSPTC